MPRREDHEVRQGLVGHWIKKKKTFYCWGEGGGRSLRVVMTPEQTQVSAAENDKKIKFSPFL